MNETVLAKQLAVLTEQKEQLNERLKIVNKLITQTGQQLYTCFVESGLQNLRISGMEDDKKIFLDGKDRIITPSVINRPAVTAKNSEDFLAWMEKEGFGSLIKRSIAPQTLKAWVDERTEANLPLPPETLMTVFHEETAKITRAPVRK
jgi:hypothetical protein